MKNTLGKNCLNNLTKSMDFTSKILVQFKGKRKANNKIIMNFKEKVAGCTAAARELKAKSEIIDY